MDNSNKCTCNHCDRTITEDILWEYFKNADMLLCSNCIHNGFECADCEQEFLMEDLTNYSMCEGERCLLCPSCSNYNR